MSDSKDLVRAAFTTQADRYATSAVVVADEARRRFVDFVAPCVTDRVLDVATGPGFLALLFAERAAGVVGVDITPAMLVSAEASRAARGLNQVRFEEGDAESLSFPDASFDIAACGWAFHHFTDPFRVLREMARVTKPAGRIALFDLITSQDAARAALHNQVEQWRDPSHVRAMPLSEHVALCARAGLRDVRTATYEMPRELEEWFAISHTPADTALHVRAALITSMPHDDAGLSAHMDGERVFFTQTYAWVVGAKA